MDLELTEDQLALRDAARSVLDDACPPSLVRSVYEGGGDGKGLWATLRELDWPGLAVPEDHGGLGLGFVETAIVVGELGRVVAPTPFLATATQLLPVLIEVGATSWLPGVAAGEVTGTLALGAEGTWSAAATGSSNGPQGVAEGGDGRGASASSTVTEGATGGAIAAEQVPGAGDGWLLNGRAGHVLDGAGADEVAVVARADEGLGVFLVPGPSLVAEPLAVMDPTLPLATVTFDEVAVDGDRVLVAPGDPRAEAVVRRAVATATVALAVSTVATCRAIFEATLAYAKEREQFGRPIGSFQAVKHRLSDCYLAIERADALAWFAVLTIAEDDERRTVAASMAKVAAGDCQRLLTRDGLQLHGGIGFTWEHDLHFALKRAATGELLLGTSLAHRARLAALLGLEEVSP